MTLRDLLKKSNFKSAFNVLYKEHYLDLPEEDVVEYDLKYRKVWDILLDLPHNPGDEYKIFIKELEEDLIEGCNGEVMMGERTVDVCLYCPEDETTYAMDLTAWEDLIDWEISGAMLGGNILPTKMDDSAVLAHILWEITFYGFSPDKIMLEREELKKLSERIESGEEKLIPWEDIEKELGDALEDSE
jgi:hypothetical protein